MIVSGGSLVITLIIDSMSTLFISFVSLISSRVLLYSSEYIDGDPNINRFIYIVLSFVASMGALIFRPNFVSILLG